MGRLRVLAIVLGVLLLVIIVVLTVPHQTTGLQRTAIVILGVLAAMAAIAEIIGLFRHFSAKNKGPAQGDSDSSPTLSPPNAASNGKNISIHTEGDRSPGIVKGDYTANG